MNRILLVALTLFCLNATAADAQPYQVEFWGDDTMSLCSLASNGVGLTSIHVVLTGSGSALAVNFGARIPACWEGATWIADDLAVEIITPTSVDEPEGDDFWLAIGTTQEAGGLSIAFRECRELPLYIGTIVFMGVAQAPCCQFPVTRPPTYIGRFTTPAEVVDCNFDDHGTPGGSVQVSSGPACDCHQLALAAEQTTWGRVKALYR
jgi:hypothetical protein